MNEKDDITGLKVAIARIEGKIDHILSSNQDTDTWQTKHEESDTKRFDDLYKRIDGLNRYAVSLAVFSLGVGVILKQLWTSIKG